MAGRGSNGHRGFAISGIAANHNTPLREPPCYCPEFTLYVNELEGFRALPVTNGMASGVLTSRFVVHSTTPENSSAAD